MGETPRRDLVLPALNAVQARIGWVSRGALNEISRRLEVPPAELWGVVTTLGEAGIAHGGIDGRS